VEKKNKAVPVMPLSRCQWVVLRNRIDRACADLFGRLRKIGSQRAFAAAFQDGCGRTRNATTTGSSCSAA